ncbi:hypothetical protein CEXT_128101 [Caerostris extrusa]|uniref:Uncharacterized protein n=1 Tax=Caerostris extrusa TaxID=172846 RepID=A0AAV4P443_CAEEX|nr:hypothetical protein CEXT_128101 [Caerostris extrusa]
MRAIQHTPFTPGCTIAYETFKHNSKLKEHTVLIISIKVLKYTVRICNYPTRRVRDFQASSKSPSQITPRSSPSEASGESIKSNVTSSSDRTRYSIYPGMHLLPHRSNVPVKSVHRGRGLLPY